MILYELQVYVDRGEVLRAGYPLWRDGMVICLKPASTADWTSSQRKRGALIACVLSERQGDELLGFRPHARKRGCPLRVNWRGLIGEERAERVLDETAPVDPIYLDPLPTFERLTEEATPW